MNGQNTVIAGNLAIQLMTLVMQAQTTGVDITPEQLAQSFAEAQASVDQLQAAIDAAKAGR